MKVLHSSYEGYTLLSTAGSTQIRSHSARLHSHANLRVTRFTPSEYAFMRVDVRAWLLKALLRMAMRRLLRALCTFVSPFHARTEGHLHACSISAPNSKEACIAQAVKSPT